MSKEDIVYLLMILNVNTYANVILERFLRENECQIGDNESILTIMKKKLDTNEWIFSVNEQQKVY